MATKSAYDTILLWDHEGAQRLRTDGHTEPVDLHSLRGKKAVVVLARRMTQTRTTELPPAQAEDLRQIVRMRLNDLFPLPAHEIAFAVAPRETIEGASTGPTAIYAARHSDLTAIHTAARTNGFDVVATLPAAAGSAELAQELGLPDALIVEHDGDGIGLDVVQDLELALSRRTVSNIDLESEIRRTFIAARTGAVPIVATNGFQMPFADRHSPRTATAVLIDKADRWPALDLVPEEVRVRKAAELRRGKMRKGALILVASLLLAGTAYSIQSKKAAEIAAEEKRQTNKVKSAQKVLDLVAAETSKLQPQAQLLKRAFEPAQPIGDIGVLITSLLPKEAWLTSLNIERGKIVTIRGTAMTSASLTAFLTNLGSQTRFRDVKLVFAQAAEVQDQPIVNFSITLFPVGNIPLEEAKKK